jgi:hypothetical protein
VTRGFAQHARGFAKFFEGKNVAIVFSDAEERNMFVDDETYGMLTPRRPGSVRYSALGGGWKGRYLLVSLSVCLSVCLSPNLRACLSVCLSICLSPDLLSVCLPPTH